MTPTTPPLTPEADLTFAKSQAKIIERALVGLRDGWASRADADEALRVLGSGFVPALPDGAMPDDDAIERAALKHVATEFHMISHLIPNYRCTEQFTRLKAFSQELFATPTAASKALDAAAPAGLDEPDMLWLSDDNEVFANSPDEFAEEYGSNCLMLGDAPVDVKVDCAYRGSKRTMRIGMVEKGDDSEIVWKWLDGDKQGAQGDAS